MMILRNSNGPVCPEAAAPAAAGRKGESFTSFSSASPSVDAAPIAGGGVAAGVFAAGEFAEGNVAAGSVDPVVGVATGGAADTDTAAIAGKRPATRAMRYRKAVMAIN